MVSLHHSSEPAGMADAGAESYEVLDSVGA
jgi:hypothetical protein